MPIYTVQGPDGKTYDIEGPAGATADQLGQVITSQAKPVAYPSIFDKVAAGANVAAGMVHNGILQPVANLIGAGKDVLGGTAGPGSHVAEDTAAQIMDRFGHKGASDLERQYADATGRFLNDAGINALPGVSGEIGALARSVPQAMPAVRSIPAAVGNSPEVAAIKAAGNAVLPKPSAQINPVLAKTLQDSTNAGFVVPPSSVKPTFLNTLQEGIAGKIATAQEASNRNGPVFESLARKAVGLPADAPLTSDAMQAVRNQAYRDGYAPISNLGKIETDQAYSDAINAIAARRQGAARSFPDAVNNEVADAMGKLRVPAFNAGDGLKMSQILRDEANKAFRAGDNEAGLANKAAAKAIEDQIERHLQGQGEDGAALLQGFRDARQLMAKAHTVEDAIVEGGGAINPRKLAARVQAGKPMTDELAVAGNFANNFPKASQPAQQVAGPGVSKLNSLAALLVGGGGYAAGGPMGIAAGAAPFIIPPLVRSRLLSQSVQQGLTKPNRLSAMLNK